MTKRVVKKKSASVPQKRAPNSEIDPEENARAMQNGLPAAPPKIHAKSVSIMLTVGTGDRRRSYEQMVADITKALNPVPYGEDGLHMTVTGGYYILDGKVCLPDDYDEKKGTFKDGATPPSWAGGPSTQNLSIKTQIQRDLESLSSDEYDKKYGLGKYGPKPVSSKVTPEARRKAPALTAKVREELEDAELEEFEWEDEDVTDDAKMGAVADESASRAVKKLKSSRKVVRRTKK